MNRQVFIYALLNDAGDIRYIGKTVNLDSRLKAHRKNKPWFDSYLIMDVADNESWAEKERYWINMAKKYEWPLSNRSDGGDGMQGVTMRIEQKLKIADALLGNKNGRWNKHSPETRLEMSIKQRQSWTPERRAKQSGENHCRPTLGKKPWNTGLSAKTDARLAASAAKSSESHRGLTPWNKGLTKDQDERLGKCGSSTSFKKGMIPWNKKVQHAD